MPYYRAAAGPQLELPTAVSATSAADDHPAENLRNHKMWITHRTTATGTQHIVWDRGALGPLDAIFFGTANFPTFNLAGSSDNISYSAIQSAVPLSADGRVNRRKKWLIVGGVQPRYIRITPTGTPDGGASYYELGQLVLMSSSLLLADVAVAPLRWDPVWPGSRDITPGGTEEVSEFGKPYLETVIQNPDFIRLQGNQIMAQLLALVNSVGPGGHLVIYENMGDDSKAYLVHRTSHNFPVDEQVGTFSATLPLREYV